MSIKRYKELVHFRSDAPLPPIQKKSNFNILKSGKSKFYSTNFTPSLLDIQYLQLLGKNNRLHTKLNTFINFYFLSGRGKTRVPVARKEVIQEFLFQIYYEECGERCRCGGLFLCCSIPVVDCEGVCNYRKITDIQLEGSVGRQIPTRLARKCKTDPRWSLIASFYSTNFGI